jgi:hypothetical protein
VRHARRLPQKGSVTVNRSHHDHGQPQAKASTNAALQEYQALIMNAVPPADLRSGMVPGLGAKVVGHQGDAVSRHVGARGVADQGQVSRSFIASGAPSGHLPLARSKATRCY